MRPSLRLRPVPLLGLLAACSSSSPTPGGSGPYTQDQFAAELCAIAERCCTGAGETSSQGCPALVSVLLSELPSFDPAAAQVCVEELQQRSMGTVDFCSSPFSTPECTAVFQPAPQGTVPPGQACGRASDCAAPDGGAALCFEGTGCTQFPPGAVGDPCLITIDGPAQSFGTVIPTASVVYACSTADGVACDIDSATCVALSQTKGPCTSDDECVAGDYCDFRDSTSRPPECFPRVGIGEVCSSVIPEGKDPECQTGSFCDAVSLTCKADAQAGWICADGSACLSGSCVSGVCRGGYAPFVCSGSG